MLVKSNRLAAQARQKKQYDRTAKIPKYQLGQQVMLKKENVTPGLTKKFAPKFDGPYYITKVGPNHTFRLIRQSNHRPIKSRVHANRLKPYFNPALRKYATLLDQQQQQRARVVVHAEQAANDVNQTQSNDLPNELYETPDVTTDPEMSNAKDLVIDKILASSYYRGERLYKVKWVDKKGTTWERKSTIPQELVNQFHIHHTATGRKRKRPHKYFVRVQESDKQNEQSVDPVSTN